MAKTRHALQIYTSNVPEDVLSTVLQVQLEIKKECRCQVSMETAFFKIVREYNKMKAGQTNSKG